MTDTVLTNARLVLEGDVRTGTLQLRDGRIAAIDDGPSAVPGAIDCDGDYLAPGLVELHTDNLERHLAPRPGVDWPLRAAIAAHDSELAGVGITTVFDALRIGSMVSSMRTKHSEYARGTASTMLTMRAEGALRISHFLHLRAEICSETLPDELEAFTPEDRVGIVSLMDHTPGQRQFTDLTQLRTYMKGKHALTDAEFDAHIAEQQSLGERVRDTHETAAVAGAHRLGAILASHDDTTAAHVTTSYRHGVRIAEFPTTVEAAAACHAHDIRVMMGAPNLVRGGSHSGNVATADLAGDGLVDILSSDYVPAALLMGALELGARAGNLAHGVATVTAAPAAAAGLTDRGRLAPGARADVIRFTTSGGAPILRGTWVQGRRVA